MLENYLSARIETFQEIVIFFKFSIFFFGPIHVDQRCRLVDAFSAKLFTVVYGRRTSHQEIQNSIGFCKYHVFRGGALNRGVLTIQTRTHRYEVVTCQISDNFKPSSIRYITMSRTN